MIVNVGAGGTATIPKSAHGLRVVIPEALHALDFASLGGNAEIQALRCIAAAPASGQPLLRHRTGQRGGDEQVVAAHHRLQHHRVGNPVFPFQNPPHPAQPVFVQHAGQLARAPAAMVRVPGVADPAEKEPAQRKHVGQRQDSRKGEGHGGPCGEWRGAVRG